MARKLLALAPLAALCFDRSAPTPESFCFQASPDKPATIDAAGKDGARRFSGVAYSGDVIKGHWYWGDVVFDLSSTKAAQKLPMLLGHDNDKIVGFSDKVAIADAITLEGALSSKTQYGQEVAALSDEGFPWQMSVRIEPSQVDEVGKGKTAMVNGRQLNGPLTIFRNSVIREVSFTPTGWDAQTSATAMSRGNSSPDQGVDMTPEEIAALKAQASKFESDYNAEKAAREKAEADAAADKAKVAAFEKAETDRKAAERTEAVKKLFADTGIKHMPESAKPYEGLDADTFAAVSAQMRQAAKARASDDPNLYSDLARTGVGGGATDAAAIAEKANELIFEAKKQGRTLDVVAACSKAKQLLTAA